ncbi:hypothetical protein pb186bvf_000102 [Paramecium bursaria]
MDDIQYKIVLLGDAGVGKTYIMNQYVRQSHPRNQLSTIGKFDDIIGVEFATKTVTLEDGGKIQASIWDTAGQERYRAITTNHFRNAGGAILVYDITKDKTFDNLNIWLETLKKAADNNVVIYVVGNKLDLVNRTPTLRKVQEQEGLEFARKNDCLFAEASAYQGTNINKCFEELIQEMYIKKNQCHTEQNERIVILNSNCTCSKCC